MDASAAARISRTPDSSLAERRDRLRRLANQAIGTPGGGIPRSTDEASPGARLGAQSSPHRRELRRLEELLRVQRQTPSKAASSRSVNRSTPGRQLSPALEDSLAWTRHRFRRLSQRSFATSATPSAHSRADRPFPRYPDDALNAGPNLLNMERPPSRSGSSGPASSRVDLPLTKETEQSPQGGSRGLRTPQAARHASPFTPPFPQGSARSKAALDGGAGPVRTLVFDANARSRRDQSGGVGASAALEVCSPSDKPVASPQRDLQSSADSAAAARTEQPPGSIPFGHSPLGEERNIGFSPVAPCEGGGLVHLGNATGLLGNDSRAGDPWGELAATQAALHAAHVRIHALEAALVAEKTRHTGTAGSISTAHHSHAFLSPQYDSASKAEPFRTRSLTESP